MPTRVSKTSPFLAPRGAAFLLAGALAANAVPARAQAPAPDAAKSAQPPVGSAPAAPDRTWFVSRGGATTYLNYGTPSGEVRAAFSCERGARAGRFTILGGIQARAAGPVRVRMTTPEYTANNGPGRLTLNRADGTYALTTDLPPNVLRAMVNSTKSLVVVVNQTNLSLDLDTLPPVGATFLADCPA